MESETFDAGVEQVWYVYPASRQVKVYSNVQQHVVLGEKDTIEGRGALAHFRLRLSEFLAPPRRPE